MLLCMEKGFSDQLWHNMVFDRIRDLPASIANRILVRPFYAVGNYPMDKYEGEEIFKINVQYFPDSDRDSFIEFVTPITTIPRLTTHAAAQRSLRLM